MVATADLCDTHGNAVQVAAPLFRHFGARRLASGRISTLHTKDDNSLVRAALEEPGEGRVLVVDGQASLAVALLGGNLAALAARNGWSAVLVNGAVRDTAELSGIDLVVLALASCPRRSHKAGFGRRDVPVQFAGVPFAPGAHVYLDEDGVVVAPSALT